jgi:6-pyruvoyltetrahydropterin/6-carboxytetrahydropterin synthase
MPYQSTKVFDGFSTAFRQWRAEHSHCRFIHGYALSFKVWFEGDLDERNWVTDFGGFKEIKEELAMWFDHTLVVAEDDPALDAFRELDSLGVADLRVMPAVGCERFAKFVYSLVGSKIYDMTKSRVRVVKVECFEHGKNSAIYVE